MSSLFKSNKLCTKLYKRSITCVKQNELRLGFLGTGRIAQAIIIGLIKQNKVKQENIYASDANVEYLRYLKDKCPTFKNFKINYVTKNSDVINNTNTVMICVKPKDVPSLLKEVSNQVNNNHLLMSLAAGVQIKNIERLLPKESRVIRIMPNLTALIQQSVSVYSRGTHASTQDGEIVKSLLESIGFCENEINEDLMDVVTALSGSGPAYMCVVLDALADGAVKMGMSRQLALSLAARTMSGTANMIVNELDKESGAKHLLSFKEEVSSPGGTTIHGLFALEENNVRHAFMKCIQSATNRAKELNSKS